MVQLTKFSYTRILDVYYLMLSKWAIKSTHFPYKGVVALCKLAAIDFNQGQTLQQAQLKSEDDRFVSFTKIMKTWSAKLV